MLPLVVGYMGQVVNPVFRMCGSVSPSDPELATRPAKQQEGLDPTADLADASDEDDDDDGRQGEGSAGGGGGAGPPQGRGGSGRRPVTPRVLTAGEVRGCITLMARMAAPRSGTLLWRKGLDLEVGGQQGGWGLGEELKGGRGLWEPACDALCCSVASQVLFTFHNPPLKPYSWPAG